MHHYFHYITKVMKEVNSKTKDFHRLVFLKSNINYCN